MRKVVNALICGETDSEVLALLVHKRIRNKHCHEVIKSSLTGIVSSSDRDMLKMSLEEVELYDRQLLARDIMPRNWKSFKQLLG